MADHKSCTVGALIWLLLAVALGFLLFHQASALMGPPPRQPRMHPPGTVIALDLGSTNSCVAGYGRGKSETMFQLCIPSWVAFADNGSVLVGDDARNHAAVDPQAAIFGFKRLIGRVLSKDHRFDAEIVERVAKAVPYKLGNRSDLWPQIQVRSKDGGGVAKAFHAEDIVSMVFAKLKGTAEAYLGHRVYDAVLTVPQHYNDHLRDGVSYAGRSAGLDGTRMLSEPIAAAIAYGLDRKLSDEGVAVVLHVGGGTTEASVLVFIDDAFHVLGANQDSFLGGDDLDQRVMDHFIRLIREKHGKDVSDDMGALWKLRTACEDAKKVLSTQDHAALDIKSLVDGVDFSESLTRAQFEELNHDLFLKIISLVDRAMVDAELENQRNLVDEIVLIGGSTVIPKIQQLVRDYFHGKKLNTRLKPDEVVAFGAALLHQSEWLEWKAESRLRKHWYN